MDLDRILLRRPFSHLAVRLGRVIGPDDHVRIIPRAIALRRPHNGHLLEQEIMRPLPTRTLCAALAWPGTRDAWIATLEDGPSREHPASSPGMIIHALAPSPPAGSLDVPFAVLRADAPRLVPALGRARVSHLLLRRDSGLALSSDGCLGGWGLPGDLRDALIEMLGSADADHLVLRAGPAVAILKIRSLRAPSPRALAIVADAR